MIITITQVEQEFTKAGAECQKITGVTADGRETTKLIFDNLKDKWGLLQQNATLNFQMVKRGQFWNVANIAPIELPPTATSGQKVLEEHQKEIDKATKPAPQADSKERSIAIAYAKDLACAGKIGVADMKRWGNEFLRYIKGEIE